MHLRGIREVKAYQGKNKLRLNIGCGPNRKEGWINIDLIPTADLTLDMRESIQLPSASCQIIYSEHFFEHLDYPSDAKRFLTECLRLLEPGGVFSIGVPDTEWPLRAYAGVDDAHYFESARGWHPSWCRTRIEHINYHFRQGTEHRFAYDFETLRDALAATGFVNVRRREFDSNLDSESRKLGTLYVDAIRPQPT
jgi:predicted SAM-dependent methyltransferase